MRTHEEFGAMIGKSLVEAEAGADVPRVAAAQFASALVAEHPTVKLPNLLASADVKQWMNESARSKNIVRVPPRSRKNLQSGGGAVAAPKANVPKSRAHDRHIVQNLPLDLL